MRSKRLGCLSGTGIVVALVNVFVIAGYVYARGGLLFNPGPLNSQGTQLLGGVTSHAQIGGQCEACHTAPWEPETMADRCVLCHTAISVQMSTPETVHGALFQNDPNLACRHCHPEHRGADAPLTVMEDVPFPHEVVGFSLNRHQLTVAREPFACNDCHHNDVTSFVVETCDTCHRQMNLSFMTAHVLSFGSTCLDCHDGVDRFDENFDHSMFSFQLTGAHANLACVQCHINARTLVDFAATPQDCFSCHQQDDAHDGNFGTNCVTCHNPSNWNDASFDHNLSNFPLTGAHANVACESCHIGGQFQGLSTACAACHAEPAFHAGLFGTECATCHNTSAWRPAQFNGQHSFPLNHGGGATCATCHPSGFTTYTCYGCHEHNEAEIVERHLDKDIPNFQNCAACHPNGEKD